MIGPILLIINYIIYVFFMMYYDISIRESGWDEMHKDIAMRVKNVVLVILLIPYVMLSAVIYIKVRKIIEK